MKAIHPDRSGKFSETDPVPNSFFREVIDELRDSPDELKSFTQLALCESLGFTMEEIGAVFGKNKSTISRNVKKARQLLHEMMQIRQRTEADQRELTAA